MHLIKFLFLSFFFLISLTAYEVRFEGIEDPKLVELVTSASLLEKLKENPPATQLGLKRRAEGDLQNILQALHSQAFYEAKADFSIKNDLVIIHIEQGPAYPLADFKINCNLTISLEDIGICLGQLALPETILDAEDTLLDEINLKGYAFATIKNREVLVDKESKTVTVIIDIEPGPYTYFGEVTISGESRLCKNYFYNKLLWREGDPYDPCKVEKTQEALELSGLFKSVNITHAEEPINGNLLPVHISVVEAKQRSMGFGINYTTYLGPGLSAEWEDRNIYGEGQRFTAKLDLWQLRQEARLTYLIPDFGRKNQNLIWVMDYHHDWLKAYTDRTFFISGTLDRKLNNHLWFSYGGMYKLIRTEHSANNGTFDLIQAPLQLRWSNADSLLDPTSGGTMTFKAIPSFQFLAPIFGYCINTFTGTFYHAMTQNKKYILATKLMLGSIVGASKHDIPPPERFYAGTENALRGYKYLTVSPIGPHHKPLGGRSLFIYSLEVRARLWKNFGAVAFYEIGNVYGSPYPDNKSMLQSVGAGIRYFTPVGPLRLDVAIPLNRRHHIDGPFQLYFSIGQAF